MSATELMAAGFDSVQVSGRSPEGVINGFAKLTSDDEGEYSGMRRIIGANAFALSRGKRVKVSPKGDNKVLGTFSFANTDAKEFALTLAEKSFTLNNFLTGLVNDTIAGAVVHPGIPDDIKSDAAVWLFSRDILDEDTGEPGYMHYLVFNAGAEESEEALGFQAEAQFGYALTPNESLIVPYGLPSSVAHGVRKNLYLTITSPYHLTFGCFIGDGTLATFTVHEAPISTALVAVFVEQADGTYLEKTPTSVNVGSKTITLASGDKPAAGKKAIVFLLFEEWS